MTVAEVVGQLRQAKEHLSRAARMIQAALGELRQAETLLRHTLGNASDPSTAGTARLISEASQTNQQTAERIDNWIARIQGPGGPGNG